MAMPHPELIYLIAWVVVFLLALVSQVVLLFAAYFRLEQIEDLFTVSHVRFNREIKGNGLFGRMNRIRLIGALTGRSSLHLMLDPWAFMEAEMIPEGLQKWVSIPARLLRTALVIGGLLLLCHSFYWLCTTLSKPLSGLKILCIATLIACFILALLAVLVRVYVSLFKLEKLESFLLGSYFVGRNRRMLGEGVYGRYSRLSHISTMLLLSDKFLSISDPSAIKGIARLPLPLQRIVTIPNRMLAYSIAGFGVIYFCATFFKLLN